MVETRAVPGEEDGLEYRNGFAKCKFRLLMKAMAFGEWNLYNYRIATFRNNIKATWRTTKGALFESRCNSSVRIDVGSPHHCFLAL